MELSREEIIFMAELALKLKEQGTLEVMMKSGVNEVADTLDQIAQGVR